MTKVLHAAPVFTTPATVIGASLVIFGSLLRLTCYRTLGQLFTFDLTILPKHTLITTGPYAYVRHPAYTGSLSMILGLALVNLTPGSWITEAGLLGHGKLGFAIRLLGGAAWWCWWLAVGLRRCRAEDAELRKTFGKQWGDYASRVPYWFVPGIL
jgi:protein-S-isoprenylcysteine O-methyltransferase Ste14